MNTTNRSLRMRPASRDDLAFIADVEATPDYAPFINRWPIERHRAALADADFSYLIFAEAGAPIGYVILTGLRSPHKALQLMRIALRQAGRGRGRACCALVMAYAFEHLGAHRLYLDIFEANVRAEHLYKSCGFQLEGVLRDAERRGDAFLSLKLMSILEHEYRAARCAELGEARNAV